MTLKLQDMEIVIPRDVMNADFLLQDSDSIQNVFVFEEDPRGISPPHVDKISEKNEVRQCGVGLKLVEEAIERGFVGSFYSQMLIRDSYDCHLKLDKEL